jgi:hypothetical protein
MIKVIYRRKGEGQIRLMAVKLRKSIILKAIVVLLCSIINMIVKVCVIRAGLYENKEVDVIIGNEIQRGELSQRKQ